MEYVILIGFFGLMVFIIVWAIKHGKKLNARKRLMFEDMGLKYGLGHEENKHLLNKLNTLSGAVKGIQVHIYEKIVGSGKHQTIHTTIQLTPSPFDFEFRIGKEHFFSKTGKLIGFKDIEFGDEKFDSLFLMKSKEEDKLKAIITHDVQHQLKQLAEDLNGSIYGNLGNITYSVSGPLVKEHQFESFIKVFDFMIDFTTNRSQRNTSY